MVAAHGNSLRVPIMVLGLTDALSAAKAVLRERIAIERRREVDEPQVS